MTIHFHMSYTIALLLLTSCATFEITNPEDGTVVKAMLGGKGCVLVERDKRGVVSRVVVEHDGMSNPLAGTLRSVVGSASSVFGGESETGEKIQAGEGCTGVLGMLESKEEVWTIIPSPGSVFRGTPKQ